MMKVKSEAEYGERSVKIELCDEDVKIILPDDPHATILLHTTNGTLRKSKRATSPKRNRNGKSKMNGKSNMNGHSHNGNLNSIDESDEEYFPDGPREKNELFESGDIAGSLICSLGTPSTPKRKLLLSSSKSGACSSSKVCTPKNKTPSSNKKSVATPLSKSTRKRKLDDDFAKVDTPTRRLPSTPSSAQSSAPGANVPKTPYRLRQRLARGISKAALREVDMVESDDSGSEYSCDDSDDTDDDSSDGSESDEKDKQQIQPKKPLIPLSVTPMKKSAKKQLNYVPANKEYFHLKGAKKGEKTSDNVLSQLKNPSMTQTQFRTIFKKITQAHKEPINNLSESYKCQFNKWMFYLSQNYSLILYGLGSKKTLLETFRKYMLSDSKVIVVNGSFPSLTVKEILDAVTKELLNIKEAAANNNYAFTAIRNKLKAKSADHIFVIINNIDGPCLREEKCQTTLSSLVANEKIHLIASIDHLHAPLLWDVAKLGNINPVWIDATTFLPYVDEISHENSFLVKHTSSTLALSSLLHVYKSLTRNAKKVYCILVDDHLANATSKNYNGMTFLNLYHASRQDLIVSSDLALRTLLQEFLDHELVKWRKDNEHLTIPVDSTVLQKFKSMQEES